MSIQLNPLADCLAENIPEDSAPHFRSQYKKLIAERDTSDVWRQFALWFLIDPDHGVIRFTKPDSPEYRVIKHVARLYDENCKDRNAWDKATRHTNRVASCAAGDAAYSAAAAKEADAAARAAAAAAFDADADVDAAAWAARAAASAAADSTAYATAHAAHAANAGSHYRAWKETAEDARDDAYKHMAKKLLKLLQLAPLKEIQ